MIERFLTMIFTTIALLMWSIASIATGFEEKNEKSFTIAETEQHFPIMAEKLSEIGEKYGYEVEVKDDTLDVNLMKGSTEIIIDVRNTIDGLEGKGWEFITFYYTRYEKGDKAFDLDFFIELINSVSKRTFTKKECQDFLFSTNSKYQKDCWAEGQLENREWRMDFWEAYFMWYDRYEESDSSDKYEELSVKVRSNYS